MAKNYFKFRQFLIRQDRSAMKVGTDGVLLGAWARGGNRILDIGSGTGLLALMMAQRFHTAQVIGVEIDHDSAEQARENVIASGFLDVEIVEADIRCFHEGEFDAIICNPPYFIDSLECPDRQRTLARHTSSLSYRELMTSVSLLLSDNGEFSVIVPSNSKSVIEQEALLVGLFKVRQCAVKTTPRKPPRRYLIAFRRHPALVEQTEGVIEEQPNERSVWYKELTKEFYL